MASTKSCASCGAAFLCGPASKDGGCWCESLPPLPPTPGADCFCPKCLDAAVKAKIDERRTLQEGEDYYSEGPAIVFTAAFLRRRGYCCGNGCRHCPYS